jgi:hypothetical protein
MELQTLTPEEVCEIHERLVAVFHHNQAVTAVTDSHFAKCDNDR